MVSYGKASAIVVFSVLLLFPSSTRGQGARNIIADVVDDATGTECPCLNKRKINIHVAAHGSQGDGFWDLVHLASNKTGRDTSLVVEWIRPPQVDNLAHAQQIRTLADSGNVSGLVVTLANDEVVTAMQYAIGKGLPVVSMNSVPSSYNFSSKDNLHLMHVAQDDKQAAVLLGERVKALGAVKCIFAVTEQLNEGIVNRRKGLESVFGTTNVIQIGVDIANLEGTQNQVLDTINGDSSINCLLSGGSVSVVALEKAIQQFPGKFVSATFDINDVVAKYLKEDKITFAVDQGQIVQGAHSVLYLYLYLATGYQLNEYFVHSGPQFVTKKEIDGFLCGTELALLHHKSECSGETCLCINSQTCSATPSCPPFDPTNITIYVATHATSFESVWDSLKLGIAHAARDIGVNVNIEYMFSYTGVAHAARIQKAIDTGAQGIVVSFPDDDFYTDAEDTEQQRPVKFAVQRALAAGIKVVAVNSGSRTQKSLASQGLLSYVGNDEQQSGALMAEKLKAKGYSKILIVTSIPGEDIPLRAHYFRNALVTAMGLNNSTDLLLKDINSGGILVRIGAIDITASRQTLKDAIVATAGIQAVISLDLSSFSPIVSTLNLQDSANNFPRIYFRMVWLGRIPMESQFMLLMLTSRR